MSLPQFSSVFCLKRKGKYLSNKKYTKKPDTISRLFNCVDNLTIANLNNVLEKLEGY